MNTHREFAKLQRLGMVVLLAGTMAAAAPVVFAQTSANSGLQSEVASRLSHDKVLSGQNIMVNTDGAQVTLSGTVQNEQQWQEAETVAANVKGVRTILNNLTIAGQNNPGQASSASQNELAPPPPPDAEQPQTPATPETSVNGMSDAGNPPPPPPDQQSSEPSQTSGQQVRPEYQGQGYGAGYGAQNYQGYNQGQSPYGNQNQYAPPPEQVSGPVSVPEGTLLQVRTVETLDSGRLQPGQMFDATVASDVWEGNVLAIPRGATLQGVIVEAAQPKGRLGGKPQLDLRITALSMGGQTYRLDTNVWTSVGPDKAGYSVGNAATGGLLGAIVGGIIGRGPGAAVGAGLGAMTGLGLSSATKGPRIYIPSEAVLNFHLTRPVTVQPVSWEEARRLASNVPQLQTRPIYGYRQPYPYGYAYSYPYYAPYPYYGPTYYSFGMGW